MVSWRPIAGGVVVLAVVALAVFIARAPGVGGPSASTGTVLRRGNGPEPESLDPHAARSEAALTILRDIYEGLTAVGADGAPILAAADHVAVSADGKTYTFHLRTAGRWSNGEPVVAEDFASAWRRLVTPSTGAQYADILSPVRGATQILQQGAAATSLGVHAIDAHTLVVELERPTAYFLGILAHPATFPLNRGALAALGRRFSKPGSLVSNGAFVLKRWDFGSHLVAVRNRLYWNDAATRLDGVEYYSFPDDDAELRAFRTGQLDVTTSIPAAQTAWIETHLSTALKLAPQLAVYYLGLNLRTGPFARARELRQALSLVIDRDRLVQSVTRSGEAPAYSFVPPQTLNYTPPLPDYAAWPMARRIARARQLLHEAGLDGPLPVLEVRYNNSELHSRIAIAVARMWKDALGIETSLRAEEFKVLLQDIDRGDAAVFRASWVADYDDAYTFLQVLRGGAGLNMPHYANPAYDELLVRASGAEPDARRVLLQDAEATMLTDQPIIPLYFYVSKHLVDAGVGGWHANVLNVVYSKSLAKLPAGGGNH